MSGNKKARAEQRAKRESVESIEIKNFTSLDHLTQLARSGDIVDASATGFLLHVKRSALLPKQFRDQLSLDSLKESRVMLTIANMNLEISGRVARTKRVDKETFEIAIDFSEDSPEYWRELLFDMLVAPVGSDDSQS